MNIIVVFLLLLLTAVILFMNNSPEFGSRATGEDYEKIKKSNYYKTGIFKNIEDTVVITKIHLLSYLKYFFNVQDSVPKNSIQVEKTNVTAFCGGNSTKLVWFGHSTVFLKVNNKKILFDPMLSKITGPDPIVGSKRFNKRLPMEIEEMPRLDAVLISHDHYDHLDYLSIIRLKDKVKKFYVPLGVGAHLKLWGVELSKIVELDWWEEAKLDDLTIIATPSRHFSGRGIFNRDKTLWGSWIIKGKDSNIFFSGDTGYNKTFKEIGDKHGPFDLTMLECGQYNEGWAQIHMMPEETVQANIDLKGKLLMPIHWGAFKLSLHPWSEPVERLLKEADRLKVNVLTPRIGEVVDIGKPAVSTKWWT